MAESKSKAWSQARDKCAQLTDAAIRRIMTAQGCDYAGAYRILFTDNPRAHQAYRELMRKDGTR